MIASAALLALGLLLPNGIGQEANPFDWPQWRGPERNATSQETGLLKRWPKGGPPMVWKSEKLGGGYSTPSVSRGRVFGMSYRSDEEIVWALDEKNGQELWTFTLGSKAKLPYNEGPRSTPTVDRDRVYALGVGGDLVCLNVLDGSVLWRRCLTKEFDGKMMSNWGYSESPLVDGDHVVVTPGADRAALAAFDKRSGKTVWQSEIPHCGGAGYSSIMPLSLKRIKMYVTWLGMKKDVQGNWLSGKGLVGVEAESGKYLWSYTKIANSTANIPTVLVRDDCIFSSNGYPDGGTCLLRVRPEKDGASIEELAYQPGKVIQNHHGGMVAVGECVYFGRGQKNGLPSCVEFKSAKILWEEERGPGRGSASVCAAEGMLYFRYEDGTLALIEANPTAYRLVSQFKLPDSSDKPGWSHPIIANGKLFVRDQGVLFCFDLKKK